MGSTAPSRLHAATAHKPEPQPAAAAARDDAPAVAVVVPTYQRPALLARCLRALLGQRFEGRYEIVVVDDGHSDATRRQVEHCARSAPPNGALRYVRPAQGRGPAVARNAGWRAAHAELIAFTDDDTVPQPDWLAQGTRALQAAGRGCAALAGRVVVPPVPREKAADRLRPTDHELMTRGLETAEFVTASAFVWRDALVRIDGFDERFRRAWREDSDLQFRLQAQVGPVGRCDAAVLHPVRPERWGVSLRQQRNTFYDALLYRKHPRLYRERVRRVPPWDYYAIVAAAIAALVSLAAGAVAPGWTAGWVVGTVAASVAVGLIGAFAARRLRRTARDPAHVAEMLATSALIPFLSVYWRLRGALHFKVWFL